MITGARLSHLIAIAFRLHNIGLIKDAPDWVTTGYERFTVEAKAENPTTATEEQLLEMLQGLLRDRFELKFHREIRDVPGFAMATVKNGPKLQEASGDETTLSFGDTLKPIPGAPISLIARKVSMAGFANLLSQIGPGPIMDKTNLQGAYDFKLSWDETNGPSIFTAMQEQLGLKLQSQKVPVSFFVVEAAERPSDN